MIIYWYVMLVIIAIGIGLIVDYTKNFSTPEILVLGICWPLTVCVVLLVGGVRLCRRMLT
jgi:Na+-transporting methylmalonyl-CoA/oxaloacetate decarboxylase beta subunit